MRNIILIGNFLSSHNGVRGVSEELYERLVSNGWIVRVTSAKWNRIERLFDMIFSIWNWRNEYCCANVEVYSGWAFFWAEIVTLCLRLLKKPYCLTLHGGNLPAISQIWPGGFQQFLKRAVIVSTPSSYLKRSFETLRMDIRYIPNAIDLSCYRFRLREKAAPRVIWLRALHSIYQPELAVRVISLLINEFPTITLLMVGPDKEDGSRLRMETLATELGVREAVHWIGAVLKVDVPKTLNQCDIFLNTTLYESFGVSVIEAAACGLPIVTTNVGELSSLWQDGHDALLVSPDDCSGMANAVRRLLKEDGLAEKLSTNARIKAEQFDWSFILPQWENLFLETISHIRKSEP